LKTDSHYHKAPKLLVADDHGRFYDHPYLRMAGQSWDQVVPVGRQKTMAAPAGLQMVFLPGRIPLGINPQNGQIEAVEAFDLGDTTIQPHAVAALLPPGYLRFRLPAGRAKETAPVLPLRAYTAVGIQGETLRVAAHRIDSSTHWDPARFQRPNMDRLIQKALVRFPHNSIVTQLARCAVDYFCCTARNIFMQTYEGALPVAPKCNARCLGCISLQATGKSPQQRILKSPKAAEIIQLAVCHLTQAKPAMVSFGQGCEGEPLTCSSLIQEAICGIRRKTDAGTIHMNTNGSRPEEVQALAQAGLQSVRVSLVSARPEAFSAYHGGDFGIQQVEEFCGLCVSLGLRVSLNLLVFPGFTDRSGELDSLVGLIRKTGVHMVQLRNLDLDPSRMITALTPAKGRPKGLKKFIETLKSQCVGLELGCFNRFVAP
jgi:pyruvate-formate lyase-activating enzyme